MQKDNLSAPFPWFGGKSRVASLVWERFGSVKNYVEPFFGSGAVLLGRPSTISCTETVNDKDALVANFWRALQSEPDAVAQWADWPCNENDLHARHAWLVEQLADFQSKVEGDPAFYDAKMAGWWVWGLCLWIGSGWCSAQGPWRIAEVDGVRQLLHVVDKGIGIHRQLLHVVDKGIGIHRQLLHVGNKGIGIHRKLLHVGDRGRGITKEVELYAYFRALADRLRRVRVCSGEWHRICGPAVTFGHGMTGVFLDPPYDGEIGRCNELYRQEDLSVGRDVQEWCLENSQNPLLRIALCGYAEEHAVLEQHGWQVVSWKANGGYGHQKKDEYVNNARERIWFSPACLGQRQRMLF